MSYTDQARAMRPLMVEAAQGYEDAVAATVPFMFNQWEVGREYIIGDRVRYGEKLYKVLITHISQETWLPPVSPSLFAEVLIPDPTIIPEWVQPDSTNPYMTGDKVQHNGKIWICTIDNNVWEPGVYGWEPMD